MSSFSSWRKYTRASRSLELTRLDKLSTDLLNSNGWSSSREKNALFEAIAVMGKAFASPRRLELLDLLAQAPRTVDELARASEQSTANTSQHLQALHAAGMVTRAREGTSVRYALAGEEVLALWLALRDASVARLAEVERAARDYLGDEVDAIGREELIARLRSGDVVLVDVRPTEEFDAGHIDRRPVDPARRARAAPRGAARRPRGRRLLSRPVLRLRPRRRTAPAGRRPRSQPPRGGMAGMEAPTEQSQSQKHKRESGMTRPTAAPPTDPVRR